MAATFSQDAAFLKEHTESFVLGTKFEVGVQRTVRVLPDAAIGQQLEISIPPEVRFVGYQTDNRLTNRGRKYAVKDA